MPINNSRETFSFLSGNPQPLRMWLPRQARAIVFLLLFFGCSGACFGFGPIQQKPAAGNVLHGYLRGPEGSRVVVFVNGVLGDSVSTWTNANGAYWPRMLLEDADFSGVDVYVHTFVSPPISTAQTIQELANRMQDYLTTDKVFEKHKEIVFLVHSMGGLVTRAFLVARRPGPQVVPMIYFFATPTTGANVAHIGSFISANPQFENMRPMKYEGYVAQLQDQWLQTSSDRNLDYPDRIASFCAYEKLDTAGFRVVEQASATNLCNRSTRGILANHQDIVKPSDRRAEAYVAFKAAYLTTFGPLQAPIRAALDESAPVLTITGLETKAILGTTDLRIKRQAVAQTYFEVGCEEHKAGIVSIPISLEPQEEIVAVSVQTQSISNLSRSLFAVESFDESGVRLRYEVEGLARVLFNCPGGGNAHVNINYVVQQKT